jgi:DNA topoisomerase-1
MVHSDPFAEAADAGLIYVMDAVPGITRERRGKEWMYRRPDGSVIEDPEERSWIAAVGIPPAWVHVWISPIPNGHILATGRDAKGRKQYRYHPRWRDVRDGDKYHRMAQFGEALPGLRVRLDEDLDRPGLPRQKVLGAAVRLMDETLIRVGNEEYARRNRSYGVTTLQHDHVKVDGTTILFEFRAKSGKEQRVRLSDPALATILHACEELPGHALFQYLDDHGRVMHIGSGDVNDYLRAVTIAAFTAKDFRTWGGSVTAADALIGLGPPKSTADARKKVIAAIDTAAARLNNTRAVCRKCYVHPRIPSSFEDGTLEEAYERAEGQERLSHSEVAVLDVVAHDPGTAPVIAG